MKLPAEAEGSADQTLAPKDRGVAFLLLAGERDELESPLVRGLARIEALAGPQRVAVSHVTALLHFRRRHGRAGLSLHDGELHLVAHRARQRGQRAGVVGARRRRRVGEMHDERLGRVLGPGAGGHQLIPAHGVAEDGADGGARDEVQREHPPVGARIPGLVDDDGCRHGLRRSSRNWVRPRRACPSVLPLARPLALLLLTARIHRLDCWSAWVKVRPRA